MIKPDFSRIPWRKLHRESPSELKADWVALSWQAKGLYWLLVGSIPRDGYLELGRQGLAGICCHVGSLADWPSIEPCARELIASGWVSHDEASARLILPWYELSQETLTAESARKAAYREGKKRNVPGMSQECPRNDLDESREKTADLRSENEEQRSETPTGINTPARTQEGNHTLKEPHATETTRPAERFLDSSNHGESPDFVDQQKREDRSTQIRGQTGCIGQDIHASARLEAVSDHAASVRPSSVEPLTLLTVWPLLVERIPWLKPDREYPATRERMKGEVTTGLPGMLHTNLVTEFGRTQKASPPVTLEEFEILCDWATSGELDFMAVGDRRSHICKQLTIAIGKATEWHRGGRKSNTKERAPPSWKADPTVGAQRDPDKALKEAREWMDR